ncbi:hypothetical protein JCM8097_005114 [Rhodosporidiobolus ruineniae]
MSPSSSSLPSLHSLAALARPSTSPTPAEEQAHHLTLLAQQRALALARQERCLARFEAAQVRLAKDVEGKLRRRVEVEVAAEEAVAAGEKGRGGAAAARKALGEARQASEAAQEGFVERYHAALASFEGEWASAEALYRRWDVVLPSVSSPSSGVEPPRLFSWLDTALPDAPKTVKAFLARLLAEDPYVFGSGLAMLPEFSSLLPSLPSPSFSPASAPNPFGALVRFLSTARGPIAVLDLARGLFETALRELVGRERGEGAETPRSEAGEGEDGGIGLGIRMEGIGGDGRRGSARERELEEMLVGVLEVLDELNMEVEVDAPTGTTSSLFTPPLSPPPTPLLPASPASLTSTSWSPSAFLSTGFSTLTSAPAAAVRTVHSVASAFPFGLPTPPLSTASEDDTPTTSPRLPSSPESPNKPLPRLPRFRPPSPPPTKSPFELLLARTAADLLALLTPSAAPTPGGSSLVEVLLRQLLCASFPPGAEETRKLLAVAIGRWFAFTRLGAFLRSPAVPLHPHPHPPSPASAAASSSSRPFFAGVPVSTAQELELLVPLHREVYVAVTEAIRAVRRGEKGSEGGEDGEGAEERELRRAARAFVEGWAGPLPIVKREEGQADQTRRLALSLSDLAGLFTAVQDVLFPSFGFRGEDDSDEARLRREVERVVLDATAGQGEREEELAIVYVAGVGVSFSLAPPLPRDPPLTPPAALPTLSGLSSADTSLLRCALHTLVSHPHLLLSSSSSTDFSAALFSTFSRASSLSHTCGEYAQHLLFSRASILVSHPEVDLAPLVELLAAPLLAASPARTDRSAQLLALAQTQLDALSASRSSLLCSARAALTRLDLRRRAYALAVLASPLGRQLRERQRAVQQGGRTEEEREVAREEVGSWRDELGVVSFFTLTSEGEEGEVNEQQERWDEALMLVETAAALAAEPAALGLTGLFAREAALLLAAEDADGGAEEAERHGLASTLLGAPGALLGSLPLPPFPTLPKRSSGGGSEASAASEAAELVFDPGLGAVSSAFSSPASSTAPTAAAAVADDYLLRLSVSLAGSLFAHLSSYALLPALPADSTDSTLALLLSPSSPLPRPRALQPRGAKPPEFVGALLRRFVEHPDLAVKLEALVELEKVLVLLGPSTAAKEEKQDDPHRSRRASLSATSTTSSGQQHLLLPPPSSSPERAFRTLQLPPALGHRRPRSRLGSGGSLTLQRLFSHTSSTGDSASQAGTASNPSSPLRSAFGESLFPPPPASKPVSVSAGMGTGGTWRRQHRRGLSVPSSSSAASASGSPPPRSPLSAVSFAAQQDSPAGPAEGQEEGGGEGEGMSTDALLPLLENAVLHFLPSLPSLPSSPSAAAGLFGTLHTLAALAPSLLFAPSLSLSSSSASQQAKAFSDVAVACLAIRADVGEEVVPEGWRALRAEEGERARQLSETATRESAPGAEELALAVAVAASQQQHHHPPEGEGDKGGAGDPF